MGLLAQTILCEDSFYKMRIYKSFIQEVFSRNLRLIFQRLPSVIQLEDARLPDIGSSITNFNMQITPYANSK